MFTGLSVTYAIYAAWVLRVIASLSPCPPGDADCARQHAEASRVIALVALADARPEDALARLSGAGGHETGFRTRVQARGGPAVCWFQVEVPRAERAALVADDLSCAFLALRRARTCGGSMVAYAGGRCVPKTKRVADVAVQLRSCVESARRGGAWRCRNWRAPLLPSRRARRARRGR